MGKLSKKIILLEYRIESGNNKQLFDERHKNLMNDIKNIKKAYKCHKKGPDLWRFCKYAKI